MRFRKIKNLLAFILPPPQATGYYGRPPSPLDGTEILYNKRKSKPTKGSWSLTQRRLASVFCVFLLSSTVATSAEKENAPPIDTRTGLQNIDTLQAEFTQTKQIALLRHSVVIAGELYMEKKNGRLAWHVASPIRYSCVITDQSLTQWDIDSNQQVTLSVDRYPWLKVLSQNLKDWFSGNFKNMSSGFTSETAGKNEMLMTPRPDNRIAEYIKSIKFHFADDSSSVSRVIFTEINGDTTDIIFKNIKINQAIPPEKWNVKPN